MRVLVVDDDPDIAEMVETILRSRGMEVIGARNGRDALRIAREQKPDVVLLDIMMPGMDGTSVLAELRRSPELDATRVVMLTARGTPKDALESHRIGADGYVTKPFSIDELVRSVGNPSYTGKTLRRLK